MWTIVVISATFYEAIEQAVPGLVETTEAREAYQPLNPPPAEATEVQAAATAEASTQAFRLAMLATALLLALGALTNALGLKREPLSTGAPEDDEPEPEPGQLGEAR